MLPPQTFIIKYDYFNVMVADLKCSTPPLKQPKNIYKNKRNVLKANKAGKMSILLFRFFQLILFNYP